MARRCGNRGTRGSDKHVLPSVSTNRRKWRFQQFSDIIFATRICGGADLPFARSAGAGRQVAFSADNATKRLRQELQRV